MTADNHNSPPTDSGAESFEEGLTEPEREALFDPASERATAIMFGTIVESRLTSILRLVMRRDKALADELFNPAGPLGAFGTKIRVAYMFRVISPELCKDLIIVDHIKDQFALDPTVTTFEDQKIAALIRNMHIYDAVKTTGEAARERIRMKGSEGRDGLAMDFLKSNALLSSKDAYRECIRNMLHTLIGFGTAIRRKEAKRNDAAPQKTSA
jgi:hypothetical protein